MGLNYHFLKTILVIGIISYFENSICMGNRLKIDLGLKIFEILDRTWIDSTSGFIAHFKILKPVARTTALMWVFERQ